MGGGETLVRILEVKVAKQGKMSCSHPCLSGLCSVRTAAVVTARAKAIPEMAHRPPEEGRLGIPKQSSLDGLVSMWLC